MKNNSFKNSRARQDSQLRIKLLNVSSHLQTMLSDIEISENFNKQIN